jgi:hypothetical protein
MRRVTEASLALALGAGCSRTEGTPPPRPDPAAKTTTTPATTPDPVPTAAVDERWRCKKDEDCRISCAKGAVSKAWYEAWGKSGECKDGCEELNVARCIDFGCVAVHYNDVGKIDPGCTRVK